MTDADRSNSNPSDAYTVIRRIFEEGFATGDGSVVD